MIIDLINDISRYAIPFILLFIPLYGILIKIKVYESFVEGARKDLIHVRIILL